MNFVDVSNRRAHVVSQLAMYGGPKKELSDSTFILCPFHSERTPSGRIYHGHSERRPGRFFCFGCGAKASWDEVAPRLGLQPFVNGPPKDEYAMPIVRVRNIEDDMEEGSFYREKQRNKRELPPNKRWRGISTNLLRKIGAYTAEFYAKSGDTSDGYWTSRRLYLPVLINGELRGYIKARLKKHTEYASYINASGPWSRTHGLFPYDTSIALARKIAKRAGTPMTVVLVEGQRDALRLIALGIPAICILGTQSWSQSKCKLLELGGVERVILFMDGDCAGIEATNKIRPSVEAMFDVVTLKLWKMTGSPWLKFKDKPEPSKAAKLAGAELWDPGCCPQRILEKLRAKYFS